MINFSEKLPGTFCSRPWDEVHIEETGIATPCCVIQSNMSTFKTPLSGYADSDSLKNLKAELLKGNKPKDCFTCWRAEELGNESHRSPYAFPKSYIRKLHIRLTNKCNFKCRMCNPKFSTAWSAEVKKHNFYRYIYEDLSEYNLFDSSNLDELIEICSKLDRLNISGGEPLISKDNLKLLDALLENGLQDLPISYSTNLSVLYCDGVYLPDYFKQFPNLELTPSCDGFGKAAEYSRTGFNFDRFLTNFKAYYPYIKEINCVLNIYSVYSIPYLLLFGHRFGIHITISPCLEPKFLSCSILTETEKSNVHTLYKNIFTNQLESFLERYEQSIIGSMNSVNYQDLAIEFKKYNSELDIIRKTSFVDTFPMLSDWYESI